MFRCEACGENVGPRVPRKTFAVQRTVPHTLPPFTRREISREYGVCGPCHRLLEAGATVSSIRTGTDYFAIPAVAPEPPPPPPPPPAGPVTGGTSILTLEVGRAPAKVQAGGKFPARRYAEAEPVDGRRPAGQRDPTAVRDTGHRGRAVEGD